MAVDLEAGVGSTKPAKERLERYAEPAPDDLGPYQTFCGT